MSGLSVEGDGQLGGERNPLIDGALAALFGVLVILVAQCNSARSSSDGVPVSPIDTAVVLSVETGQAG